MGTFASADRLFLEPARHIARLRAANAHPTYLYRFSYVPESQREVQVGAPHFSEVPFVFDALDEWIEGGPTENDKRVAEQIRAYWIAFVRNGQPAPEGLPAWPPHDPSDEKLLDFRIEGPVVGPDPIRDRLDLAKKVAETR